MNRLKKEYDRLLDMYDKTNDVKYLMDFDSLIHFMECSREIIYGSIRDFAKTNNFKRVYDIGCANGYQSELFLDSEVEYIGVNEGRLNYWNADRFKYISKHYPFEIKANEDDLAASVLCLTWNCYLHENEKTLHEQCQALSRDFKQVLLYMDKEKIDFVSKYFKNHEVLGNDLVYFNN